MRTSWLLLFPVLCACNETPVGEESGRDWTPPELEVRAPARGTIAAAGTTTIEVRGRVGDPGGSGIARLTVNGAEVTADAAGDFRAEVRLLPGISLIQTKAIDREGNERSETRAVLSGDLAPLESVVDDGVVVRLDRELLAVVAQAAQRRIDAIDLEAEILDKNPLVDAGIRCLSARVEVKSLSKGPALLSLVPVANGLELDASISALSAAVHVKYDVACQEGEGDIVLTAKRFRLAGPLGLTLGADGKAQLDASQLEVALEEFEWGGDVLPERVRELLDQPLADGVAAFLADELRDRLPALVADRLGGKEHVIELGDEQLVMSLRPREVRADARGVLLALDTRIYVVGAPGTIYPRSRQPRPDLDADARAIGLAISDDALNQALSSLWGAGVLDRSQSVPTEKFQRYGIVFNHLDVVSRLPPVVEALPGAGGLRITLGDVEAQFELRQPGRVPLFVGRLALSVQGTFFASVVDNHLTLGHAEPEIAIDVLPEKSQVGHAFNQESLRALADFVTETLVTVLDDAVANVPLPGVEGLRVVNGAVSSASAGGYLVVRGDVALE
jgi:hypothetical protein